MRFWDSSAVVPVLVEEATSARIGQLFAEDRGVIVWWATPIECTSAIVRRERRGEIEPAESARAMSRLDKLMADWTEVLPSEHLRSVARRMLRVHDLRASDALQLAAAVIAAASEPRGLEMVCLDQRLSLAAQKEGLRTLPSTA